MQYQSKSTKRVLKIAMLLMAGLLAVGAWTFIGQEAQAKKKVKIKDNAPAPKRGEDLYPVDNYGWLTYYMHEVFEAYNQAQAQFEADNVEQAQAYLEVMDYYADISLEMLPEKDPHGKPFDQQAYQKIVETLKSHSKKIRKNMSKGIWSKDKGSDSMDPMMETCVACHSRYNVPTDFHVDTKYKVLTKAMHEIYEHYRQAGKLLNLEEWDQAKIFFVTLDPYLELIPGNIPESDPDGNPVNQELFMKYYRQLKNYNRDIIDRLTTKVWQTGKPLPAPTVVVDNCYQCHAKIKVKSPW